MLAYLAMSLFKSAGRLQAENMMLRQQFDIPHRNDRWARIKNLVNRGDRIGA
jgi:hypothetical protein